MTVYFIAEKGNSAGPVKIGVSATLERRLSSLQSGHHQELEIIATVAGGRETEAYFHEMLSAHRVRGEWFARSPEVESAIRIARRSGAGGLPLSDPGISHRYRGANDDVAAAKAVCREIVGHVIPNEKQDRQVAWLARSLKRRCPSITAARVKKLLHGEARRVDHFEMDALKNLRADLHRHCDDRNLVAAAPHVSRCMGELGAPFTAEQQDIIDRNIEEAAGRLRADRHAWGFGADYGSEAGA